METIHKERKILPYTAEQMYDLVLDVESYPQFLPWVQAARVREREVGEIIADLIVGFKGLTEKYTSRIHFDESLFNVDIVYEDGPFKTLDTKWCFYPVKEGVDVDFFIRFEFKSLLLQKMVGLFFTEAIKRMVSAFEMRAQKIYNPQAEQHLID